VFGLTAIIDLNPQLPISISIIFDIVTTNGLFIHLQIVPFRGNQSFKASPEFDSLRRAGDFLDHQTPKIQIQFLWLY